MKPQLKEAYHQKVFDVFKAILVNFSEEELTKILAYLSNGVPVIGCSCSICQSDDPHNKRMRPTGLLTIEGKKILIDVGTDFRMQALKYAVNDIDGVILTHAHHDHTAGVDELRAYQKELPILLSKETADEMCMRYSYIFSPKKENLYTRVKMQILQEDRGSFEFLGIHFSYFSFIQAGMKVLGIRYQNFAYVSDIREYPDTIFEDLKGVETLVLSALRYVPTKMHFSVDEAIEFSKKVGAKKTYFTHISHDLDHEQTNAYLPSNIEMGYDGLSINV